jgi:hypothetical protein
MTELKKLQEFRQKHNPFRLFSNICPLAFQSVIENQTLILDKLGKKVFSVLPYQL